MQSAKKPLVSVIIPVYNSSLFIAETLRSVLSQSISELEVILVDDGSRDNTLMIVQDAAKRDPRIKYFTQKRSGVSIARNKGIREAAGKYIAFIDHDDLWAPQKLEKQLDIFRKDSQVALVFSRAAIILENGKIGGLVGGVSRLYRGYVFRELFSEHFVPLSTVVIKREVFDSLDQWFVENMEMAEEVELFLRIALKWKIDYCDEILARWRMHSNNDSRFRRNLLIDDYNRIIKRLKERIPDFERKFKKEIFKKQRWIAAAEIEILVLEKKRKAAVRKVILFLRKFGLYPKSLVKFFILFIFGFSIYEKIKTGFLKLYGKIIRI